MSKKKQHTYFLHATNPKKRSLSYIGYTANPKRRVRQHNGKIKGGAKSTRRAKNWSMICLIRGFSSSSMALKFEKMSQNYRPTARRSWTRSIPQERPMVSNVIRLNSFLYVLLHPIFKTESLVIYVDKNHIKKKYQDEETLNELYKYHTFELVDGPVDQR